MLTTVLSEDTSGTLCLSPDTPSAKQIALSSAAQITSQVQIQTHLMGPKDLSTFMPNKSNLFPQESAWKCISQHTFITVGSLHRKLRVKLPQLDWKCERKTGAETFHCLREINSRAFFATAWKSWWPFFLSEAGWTRKSCELRKYVHDETHHYWLQEQEDILRQKGH